MVSAFGRIIRESKGPPPAQVIYDDTPIHVHMKRVHELIVREGAVQFGELFEPAMHKSTLIGLFLAVLELTRHHGVVTRQPNSGADIEVLPGPRFSPDLQVAEVDNYRSEQVRQSNLPINPR